MNEYEICIETINPCGGSKHAIREIIEAECESPEAYVKANGRFPVIDTIENKDGDQVIIFDFDDDSIASLIDEVELSFEKTDDGIKIGGVDFKKQ